MEQFKTNIEFNDDELRVLNDVLRTTKVTFSSEEALLLKLGRGSNPLLDLTHKIGVIFEERVRAVQSAQAAPPQAELS